MTYESRTYIVRGRVRPTEAASLVRYLSRHGASLRGMSDLVNWAFSIAATAIPLTDKVGNSDEAKSVLEELGLGQGKTPSLNMMRELNLEGAGFLSEEQTTQIANLLSEEEEEKGEEDEEAC